jgi:hypothetical protein
MDFEPDNGYFIEAINVNVQNDLVFSIFSISTNDNIYQKTLKFSKESYKDKLSVVMPYRNRLRQCKTSLSSLSKTNYKNVEVMIVVDDNDDTVEDLRSWLSDFRFPVKMVYIDKNNTNWADGGICDNIGVHFSTAETIVFQSAECVYIGDVLSHCADHIIDDNYLLYSCCGLNDDHYTDKIIS